MNYEWSRATMNGPTKPMWNQSYERDKLRGDGVAIKSIAVIHQLHHLATKLRTCSSRRRYTLRRQGFQGLPSVKSEIMVQGNICSSRRRIFAELPLQWGHGTTFLDFSELTPMTSSSKRERERDPQPHRGARPKET